MILQPSKLKAGTALQSELTLHGPNAITSILRRGRQGRKGNVKTEGGKIGEVKIDAKVTEKERLVMLY